MCRIIFGVIATISVAVLLIEKSEEGKSPLRSSFYGTLEYEDDLTDNYEVLLLELAKRQSAKSTVNVVLSHQGCSVCDSVLAELMNALAQTYLTFNLESTGDSIDEKNTGLISSVGKFRSVIFLTVNVPGFIHKFSKLRLKYAWNPRAEHLIFAVIKPNADELEMVFNECWTHRVLNVAVIVHNRGEAYTYNPYLNHRLEMREVVDWSGMFYDKLRNMNGHSIRSKYIPYSGSGLVKWVKEERVFKIFGTDFGHAKAVYKAMNATSSSINVTEAQFLSYQNFTYRYERWADHHFGGSEMWLNYMPYGTKFKERIERSYPVARGDIRILAPKSSIKMPSLLAPYNKATWICVLTTLAVFSIYLHIFNKLRGIIDNALFRTLGVFLGMDLMNGRQELVQRFTFAMLMLFSLLILNAYQGSLYSVLATSSYHPEIDTLPQLHQRTKSLWALQNIAVHLPRKELGLRVFTFDTVAYVDYMATHRDEAYAFSNTMADYISRRKILSENGVPFYHIMKEYFIPGFRVYFLPYGSPYLEKIDRIVLACNEAGLSEYWKEESYLQDILTGDTIISTSVERPLKKLSLHTQLMSFYIWGAGLFTSLCCFIAEIYFYHDLKKGASRRPATR
ncbi:uncharacterized protein [Neodiprion pinetum]|uniref:uncharacterized protein n=1 Tax=Neodiprion pinetum TaxID=441929 RepID=UPI001EDF6A70|nr:uncharacterized protein LOC124220013 [Neodiprion pinetum]